MLQALYLILEVLVVIVPVLLAVAFMTIIERKQLASMQRRVGPNTVGKENSKFKNKILIQKQNKRFYHSSSKSISKNIKNLYKK